MNEIKCMLLYQCERKGHSVEKQDFYSRLKKKQVKPMDTLNAVRAKQPSFTEFSQKTT